MARGGMRTPNNPAPVSGPGRLSRRTDGGPQQTAAAMTGMAYGENQEFEAIQGAAPMAATPPLGGGRPGAPSGGGMAGLTAEPLFSPTGFPDEPITAGADFGPGVGPDPMASVARQQQPLSYLFSRMASNDPTGDSMAMMSIFQRLGL